LVKNEKITQDQISKFLTYDPAWRFVCQSLLLF
jgi:hypothetical protein